MSGLRRFGRDRDRGAVLIEFALITPVLVLIMLGIFEYGNAWRQITSIERATQQGGRTVSSQANGRYADYETLRAIDAAMSGTSGLDVVRVVIWNANSNDTVPPACLATPQSGLCNTYTGSVLTSSSTAPFPGGSSTAPSCAGGVDASWCPVGRNRTGSSPDRIGVHITAEYTPVTGLLPGPKVTIERSAIYQIEPCAQGMSTC